MCNKALWKVNHVSFEQWSHVSVDQRFSTRSSKRGRSRFSFCRESVVNQTNPTHKLQSRSDSSSVHCSFNTTISWYTAVTLSVRVCVCVCVCVCVHICPHVKPSAAQSRLVVTSVIQQWRRGLYYFLPLSHAESSFLVSMGTTCILLHCHSHDKCFSCTYMQLKGKTCTLPSKCHL